MGKIRVKILALCASVFMIFGLCSCAGAVRFDDYRSRPFRCEIDFSVGSRAICARIYAKGSDDVRMELLSPEAVEGVILCRDGENEYAEYGEMIFDAEAFGEILSYCRALVPEGNIVKKSRARGRDGEICLSVKEDEFTGGYFEIYVDKKSGIPREIFFDGKSVTVRNFEFLE